MNRSAFLYLDELLDRKEPIYVRNVYKTRGIIVVTLNDTGKPVREAIPDIKYPICLSNRATPDMIRNSASLRRLLDLDALELVPKDQAEKELSQAGAIEAIKLAYAKLDYKNPEVLKSKRTTDNDDELSDPTSKALLPDVPSNDDMFSNDYDEDIGDAPSEDGEDLDVSVKVLSLVDSLASGDLKSRQVRTELSAMTLSEGDLAYIIKHTTGIVQKYAKQQYAESSDSGGFTEIV